VNWRLYRLPGSREVWHVDQGDGTFIVNVKGFEIYCRAFSVDIGSGNPRAWIAIPIVESDLHIVNEIAVWSVAQCRVAVAGLVAAAVPTGTTPVV
jgi:hypothetical protein